MGTATAAPPSAGGPAERFRGRRRRPGMSSERGNVSRTRPQRHQNARAFQNDKYDTSARLKKINAKLHDGVCQHCKGILEWRVKFRKYKLLTKPKRCFLKEMRSASFLFAQLQRSLPTVVADRASVSAVKDWTQKNHWAVVHNIASVKCLQKTVKDPYHVICRPCAGKLEICAKCGKQEEIVIPIDKGQDRTESETSENGQENSELKDELEFDTNFSSADSGEDSDMLEEQFKSMNFETTEI